MIREMVLGSLPLVWVLGLWLAMVRSTIEENTPAVFDGQPADGAIRAERGGDRDG